MRKKGRDFLKYIKGSGEGVEFESGERVRCTRETKIYQMFNFFFFSFSAVN